MANTINDQAAGGSPWNFRETTGVNADNFLRAYKGEVLRARCSFDGSGGTITIDSPIQNNEYNTTTGQRIFPVGLEYAVPSSDSSGCKLTIYSKVGSATALQLGTFPLNTYGGILKPINLFEVFSPTDQGGVLQIATDAALYFILHYVIADSMRPHYFQG